MVDDPKALAALRRGYASNVFAGYIVNAYHALQISLGCSVAFRLCDKHRNPGGPMTCDGPRAIRRALRSLGLPRDSFRATSDPFVPTLTDFTSPPSVWLGLARAGSS